MITCYFGVPGCGKTTLLTKIAIKELKKKYNPFYWKKTYDFIYTINFDCPGCVQITYDDLAKFKFVNCLILIDEITLNADNRNFKQFTQKHKEFFLLHRHFGIDIVYATQNFENVDKKIRDITQDLWYMSKSVIPLFSQFTTSKRIYRCININEHTSELTLGYRFCNIIESFFVSNFKIVFRPFYYKYFDSYDELNLKDRPIYDKSVTNFNYPKNSLLYYLNKLERRKENCGRR